MLELVLPAEGDAIPQARRFVRVALADSAEGLVEDAEMVMSELATNAALHGVPPVTVRVVVADDLVRIEVDDHGQSLPVQVRTADADAMTGRGLSLVAALSSQWGIEITVTGGKRVWAELSAGGSAAGAPEPQVDVDALLSAWADDAADRGFTVNIGRAPTKLLVAAKAHLDNVVRELMLAATDSAVDRPLSPAMASLVDEVAGEFAAVRAELKRVASEAAARGDVETDIVVTLPASAVDGAARYLAALDAADAAARADRLLSLAAPRSHRLLRQWYVAQLVSHVQAAEAGARMPPIVPFAQFLADDADQMAAFEQAWDQLQLLKRVTGDLTGARTVQEVADRFVENAGRQLGWLSARLFLVERDDYLRSIAWYGRPADAPDPDPYETVPLDARVPVAEVARTGEPMSMRSLGDAYAKFSELVPSYYATERAVHLMPLSIGERSCGVLSMTFDDDRFSEPTGVEFVRALADTVAQAIERALLTEASVGDRRRVPRPRDADAPAADNAANPATAAPGERRRSD